MKDVFVRGTLTDKSRILRISAAVCDASGAFSIGTGPKVTE
jgi:hypothetical protein